MRGLLNENARKIIANFTYFKIFADIAKKKYIFIVYYIISKFS